jgi:hypothetical protein
MRIEAGREFGAWLEEIQKGDDWYDSATPRAEASVDQWQREHLEEQT